MAALDASYHPTTEPQSATVDWGLNLFGLHTIQQLEAVTWHGDLGGAVYQTMNARLDAVPYVIRFNTLVPEIERCEGLPADAYADKGYCVEMPKEDVEGDVMGIVIVTNADALGLTAANPQPLGTALAAAYDPAGLYYPQRYTRFADHYGLTINPQTMTFTPESRGQFIETHQGAVSAYGSGLYFRENILNVDNYGGLSYIPTEATRVLQRFLNDLEHGIQATAVMP